MTCVTFIVINFFAVFIQFGLLATTIIKTMQMNFDTGFMKRFQFEKDVDRTAVIGWIRDIECKNIELPVR